MFQVPEIAGKRKRIEKEWKREIQNTLKSLKVVKAPTSVPSSVAISKFFILKQTQLETLAARPCRTLLVALPLKPPKTQQASGIWCVHLE